ncbi:unnamed protein product [Dovyalis caffra]|uniref:3-dehydroquinate synthase II n=1 Tax=Dovyalis caffra TaxID=77055 RepID=A0AAV1S5D0_9ROSI|nr:unnamed protein product [Dovyalis caffra]
MKENNNKETHFRYSSRVSRCSTSSTSGFTMSSDGGTYEKSKRVWIWTESKQVMTAAVERGWNTFIFLSKHRQLAIEWSSIAFIYPLFIEEGEVLDGDNKRVANIFEVSTPQELQQLQPENGQAENVIIDLLDWQIIPAENIVAAFQGSRKTVFAISKTHSEAQIYLEALEHGLGGVVLKVEDVEAVLKLEDYFNIRNEANNLLSLTKAIVTRVQVAEMGDRVCVDLCSLMKPGEGLLVGSFARGLFLVHSECLESSYIASRPFRVNAVEMDQESYANDVEWVRRISDGNVQGPVHAYVSIPGGRTSYLSELKAGKEVIVVDQKGQRRTAIVGRIESDDQTLYSIFLQNAETVGLVAPCEGNGLLKAVIPVTSLKVGDEDLIIQSKLVDENMDCIIFLLSRIVVPLDSALLASEGKALLESGWWSNCSNLPSDYCRWPGIVCNEAGSIIGISPPSKFLKLDLNINKLVGSIPLEIGNMKNLEVLDLSNNALIGPIPQILGNLEKLEELDLDHNNLVGPIPFTLNRLSSLSHPILYCNEINGSIPLELGNLKHFEELNLDFNKLIGLIPHTLGNLTNLSALNLSSN